MSTRHLPSITEIPCTCMECEWTGVTGDCEADIKGDGELGCPVCFMGGWRIEVVIHQEKSHAT